MTSLPIVPSKFYQVCRLCMNVVSDTNDLVNLSVFGRTNCGAQSNCEIAQNNSGVIVKTSTANNVGNTTAATRKSSIHNDDKNHDDETTVTNSSDNEAAGADDETADDEQAILNNNNNFKIDSDLQQSDVLERIHTFLSITVSTCWFFFHIFFFSISFHILFSCLIPTNIVVSQIGLGPFLLFCRISMLFATISKTFQFNKHLTVFD